MQRQNLNMRVNEAYQTIASYKEAHTPKGIQVQVLKVTTMTLGLNYVYRFNYHLVSRLVNSLAKRRLRQYL